MIHFDKKEMCCGCAACAQICPQNCIQMEADCEGFMYPVVSMDQCLLCGLCETICPMTNDQLKKTAEQSSTYISLARNTELRERSSSGGLFSVFAERVLQDGGMVFGAAFDPEFQVHHIGVSTESEIYKLRGSKYLQSRSESTFKETKAALEQGIKVLYSGTACQIAGLKAYLQKEYANLLTIDVLCHGVPSPKVWKKYLSEREDEFGAGANYVSFREKTTGWKDYSVNISFQNNTSYQSIYRDDPFMRLFLSNICLRPSCHHCKFKDMNRPSDITIGDCWGIQNHSPELDDNKGTSVVVIHSESGRKLFESADPCLRNKKAELDVVLPPSADSRKSVQPHDQRERFFRIMGSSRIQELEKLLEPRKPSYVSRIKRKMARVFHGL